MGNFGAKVGAIHILNKVDQNPAGRMTKLDVVTPGKRGRDPETNFFSGLLAGHSQSGDSAYRKKFKLKTASGDTLGLPSQADISAKNLKLLNANKFVRKSNTTSDKSVATNIADVVKALGTLLPGLVQKHQASAHRGTVLGGVLEKPPSNMGATSSNFNKRSERASKIYDTNPKQFMLYDKEKQEGLGNLNVDAEGDMVKSVHPREMLCSFLRYAGSFQHTILSEKQFNKLTERRKKDLMWKEILY
jgi:hypothetical protein